MAALSFQQNPGARKEPQDKETALEKHDLNDAPYTGQIKDHPGGRKQQTGKPDPALRAFLPRMELYFGDNGHQSKK